MTALTDCGLEDRERRLEALATRAEGDPADVELDEHLPSCAHCREQLAVLQGIEAATQAWERHARSSRTAPRWRLLVIALLALSAGALAAVVLRGRAVAPPAEPETPRAPRTASPGAGFLAAEQRAAEGRFPEALAAAEAWRAQHPGRSASFQVGRFLLELGRNTEAVQALRLALDQPREPAAGDYDPEPWYVAAHLAAALVGPRASAGDEREAATLSDTWLADDGVGPTLHRAKIWSALAVHRALARGDLVGGREALAHAEEAASAHREAMRRAGGIAEDSHYYLHARFAFAQIVDGDTGAARRAAAEAAKAKRQAGGRAPAQRDNFEANALEFEAAAELGAARRGEAVDLAPVRRWLQEADLLRARSGHVQGRAWSRTARALLELLDGRPEAALAPVEAAAADAAASGDPDTRLDALLAQAEVLVALRRTEQAREAWKAAEALARERGADPRGVALATLAAALGTEEERATALSRLLDLEQHSPLADVQRVARRSRLALESGASAPVGIGDAAVIP